MLYLCLEKLLDKEHRGGSEWGGVLSGEQQKNVNYPNRDQVVDQYARGDTRGARFIRGTFSRAMLRSGRVAEHVCSAAPFVVPGRGRATCTACRAR